MLVTTTDTIEGRRIVAYKGLVAGEAILGANLFRDLFAFTVLLIILVFKPTGLFGIAKTTKI